MNCFTQVYQITSERLLAGQRSDAPGSFCIFPPDSVQVKTISFTELTEIKLQNFLIRTKLYMEKPLPGIYY
jgi:hypothetical protein